MQYDSTTLANAMRAKMHRFNLDYCVGSFVTTPASYNDFGLVITFIGQDRRRWYVNNCAGILQALSSVYVNYDDFGKYIPFFERLVARHSVMPDEAHDLIWQICGKVDCMTRYNVGLTNDDDLPFVYNWLADVAKVNQIVYHCNFLEIGPMTSGIPHIKNFWNANDTPEQILMESDLYE